MTTLTDFAPKTGWRFNVKRNGYAIFAPVLDYAQQEKECAFFLDSVTKGCYGNCEAIYHDGMISAMGYEFTPDNRVEILVRREGTEEYVVRYLPGRIQDYTIMQIDKWVREFDGSNGWVVWCVAPAVRWLPSLKDEYLYDVKPNARPTITNDTF